MNNNPFPQLTEQLAKDGLTDEQIGRVIQLMSTPLKATPLNHAVAELLEGLRDEIRKMSGKWLDRERAAFYLCTSESTVDQAANAGLLRRRYLFRTPVFDKADLDKLVTESKRDYPRNKRKQQEPQIKVLEAV